MSLANKKVFITGVSRGIGLSIAKAFKNNGAIVIGTGTKDNFKNNCDEYFSDNNVTYQRGVKGLASGIFMENIGNQYYDTGTAIVNRKNETEYNLGGKDPAYLSLPVTSNPYLQTILYTQSYNQKIKHTYNH